MNRETTIWSVLFVGGALFLAYQTMYSSRGVGKQYVVPIELSGRLDPNSGAIIPLAEGEIGGSSDVLRRVKYEKAAATDAKAVWSPLRSSGVWVAAFLTLCVFSYLYRDNVFYKFAESIIVGVSAGYWIVFYFWEVLVTKVLAKLSPDLVRYLFLPDLSKDAEVDLITLIPAILGFLVFSRWLPKIGWLSRWPLAFVVGTYAGLKLILFLNADFVRQIRSTILPLIVFSSNASGAQFVDWKQSVQNIVIVGSVISCLTYFYFSVEHKGVVGRISRIGIWVLMISFGASFALTVMSRITLLTMRLQFLFDDWLGLIRM